MAGNQIGTGIATGSPGSEFALAVSKSINGTTAGTAQWVPDIGDYIVTQVGTNIQGEVYNGTAWELLTGKGASVVFLHADGANIRFNNTGTATQTLSYIKIGASSLVTVQAT